MAERKAAQTLADVKAAMKIDYFADSSFIEAQTEKYREGQQ